MATIGGNILGQNNPNTVMSIDNAGNVTIIFANYTQCPAHGNVRPHSNTGLLDFSATFSSTGGACLSPMVEGTAITGAAYMTVSNGQWTGIQIIAAAPNGAIFWFPGNKE